VVTPVAAFAGARYSTTAVAWALVIGWAPAALPGVVVALRAMKMPLRDYLEAMRPALVGCAIMSLAVMGVRSRLPSDLAPIASLGVQSASGAAVYCAVLVLLFRNRMLTLYRLIRAARSGSAVPPAGASPVATGDALAIDSLNRPSGGRTN
jgi:hypothetical protein